MNLASIPSPSTSVWELGPFPLRAYALAIIVGIAVAMVVADRRWVARGGRPGIALDLAVWVIPLGIIGGRAYHVLTSWSSYFGEGADPVRALKVWEGGLGIWGAVVLGGVGAWIGCRRQGIPLPPFADALAPGLALAQAIGRLGNWFNQELFGRPTDLPWGLEISPENRPVGYAAFETFHPTFLYEALWCVGVALVVVAADRRFRMGHGRVFALYVALYGIGRTWIETLRIDAAPVVAGLRWNVWVAIAVTLGAIAYLVISARLRPGREDPSELLPREDRDGDGPSVAADTATDAHEPAVVTADGVASDDPPDSDDTTARP